MLFSTFSHTSQWVRFSGHFRHTCECSLTRSTFCIDVFTVFHLGVFFSRVNVCCGMVQAKCLHPFVLLFLNSLIMGTAEEATASDILVGAQPRIICWTCARSSSCELVDTATPRRQQRVEDAARVGLQFPFRSERRGRGAPSVAMARHSPTTFAGRSIWHQRSSGPWRLTHSADGMTAAHLTSAADRSWSCHHSPFRVLRPCCVSSTSNSVPKGTERGSSYAV